MKKILIFLVLCHVLNANAQMYLEVVSSLKHLGSVAAKDVINDKEGNPCAKLMFELSVADVVFSSPNIVGDVSKKIGRYECFVSIPRSQVLDITVSHPDYGKVVIPLWSEEQPIVSREVYYAKIEGEMYESYSKKYAEEDGNFHRTELPEVSKLETKYVSNMSCMFLECSKLKEIAVSHFNTSNVTNMKQMFAGCYYLTSLDLKNFDTSKVTDMSYLFASSGLTSLDLSSFCTDNVKDMSYMFWFCQLLASLNIRSFRTEK